MNLPEAYGNGQTELSYLLYKICLSSLKWEFPCRLWSQPYLDTITFFNIKYILQTSALKSRLTLPYHVNNIAYTFCCQILIQLFTSAIDATANLLGSSGYFNESWQNTVQLKTVMIRTLLLNHFIVTYYCVYFFSFSALTLLVGWQ